MKKYFAEFVGTFALVFCGTGAIVINEVTGGSVTHLGIAITFGAIVLAMIYAFGDISGAHINPAVTISFWVAGRFKKKYIAPYLIAQFSGGIFASVILKFLFPRNELLGSTLPAFAPTQSFVLEIILTFFLMLVIIYVSTGAKEKGLMAGIAIGGVVMLEAIFAGPISGASMNPARSLAPALISRHFEHLWIYLTAPIIGAILSIGAWKIFNQ